MGCILCCCTPDVKNRFTRRRDAAKNCILPQLAGGGGPFDRRSNGGGVVRMRSSDVGRKNPSHCTQEGCVVGRVWVKALMVKMYIARSAKRIFDRFVRESQSIRDYLCASASLRAEIQDYICIVGCHLHHPSTTSFAGGPPPPASWGRMQFTAPPLLRVNLKGITRDHR